MASGMQARAESEQGPARQRPCPHNKSNAPIRPHAAANPSGFRHHIASSAETARIRVASDIAIKYKRMRATKSIGPQKILPTLSRSELEIDERLDFGRLDLHDAPYQHGQHQCLDNERSARDGPLAPRLARRGSICSR